MALVPTRSITAGKARGIAASGAGKSKVAM